MTITQEIEAKWRSEFEQWFSGDSKISLKLNSDGDYIYMAAHSAWGVWLAARSTVEIELPKLISGSGASHVGHSLGVQQCWAHIESQGYRVKGEM